jgi:hypothetical protein
MGTIEHSPCALIFNDAESRGDALGCRRAGRYPFRTTKACGLAKGLLLGAQFLFKAKRFPGHVPRREERADERAVLRATLAALDRGILPRA